MQEFVRGEFIEDFSATGLLKVFVRQTYAGFYSRELMQELVADGLCKRILLQRKPF